jgi:tetratricopeptide (TPR) repeat protein
MEKNSIIFGIIGLIVGLTVGFAGANYLNKNSPGSAPTAQNQISPENINLGGNQNAPPGQGGMLPDVQKFLDQAKNEPDNYEAQIKAGELYRQIKRIDKALDFFQRAQKLKPDNFEANASLGNAYFDSRQFEDAEKYYIKALEINPKDFVILTDLGATFIERSSPNFERALEYFDKALEIRPNYEPTIYNIGIAYLKKGEKEKAKDALTRLKEANPGSTLISRLDEVINKNNSNP